MSKKILKISKYFCGNNTIVIMKFKAKCIESKLEKYHLNIQKFIELMTLKLLKILEIKHEDFKLLLINLQLVRKRIRR